MKGIIKNPFPGSGRAQIQNALFANLVETKYRNNLLARKQKPVM